MTTTLFAPAFKVNEVVRPKKDCRVPDRDHFMPGRVIGYMCSLGQHYVRVEGKWGRIRPFLESELELSI